MEEKEKDNKVCIAQIEQIIEQNKQEMIEALAHVIRQQSDQAEPVTAADGSVYPFGAGVQQAYETVLTIRSWGSSDIWTWFRQPETGISILTAVKSRMA